MKKNITKFVSVVSSLTLPIVVFAQIKNPLGGLNNIQAFVSEIMKYVVRIGGIIAIFAFIYSGYLFVKARGSDKGLSEAKTVFFNTVIGVAILLGAQIIASIIVGTINNLRQ